MTTSTPSVLRRLLESKQPQLPISATTTVLRKVWPRTLGLTWLMVGLLGVC